MSKNQRKKTRDTFSTNKPLNSIMEDNYQQLQSGGLGVCHKNDSQSLDLFD